MRTSTVIAVLVLAGTCAAGIVACKPKPQPSNSVWFGPGSAPNQAPAIAGIGVGMFTAASPMNEARVGHTATVLGDGRILVVGGRRAEPANDPNNIVSESELYDPVADTWTQVSQLPANMAINPNPGYMYDATGAAPTIRQEHGAVVLQAGTVLITGGCGVDAIVGPGAMFGALSSVYRFEPTNNQFFREQPMNQARYFHLSGLMVNGQALVAGGVNSIAGNPPVGPPAVLLTGEIYTATGWTAIAGPMGGGHTWGNIHQLQNDTYINNGVFIDSVAPMGAPVQGALVRGIQTGMVWPGGSTNGQFPGNNGELFDPTAAQAMFAPGPGTQRQTPPNGIILSGSCSLSIGDIFYAGGENLVAGQLNIKNQGALSATEIMRLQTRIMDPGPDIGSSQLPIMLPGGQTAPAPPFPVTELECEEIGFTSDVMMIGGVANNGTPIPFAEQWNYINNFMIGPPIALMQARHGHRLAKLPNSQILVIGGLDDGMPEAPLASCEIWSR